MELSVPDLKPHDVYRLLIGSVVPRPIAWVTTQNLEGVVNAAPFSCYTFVSTVPPLLAVSCGRKGETLKDTPANARETGEFVVNVVSEELVDGAHSTSGEFPPDVSEVDRLGIAVTPSRVVRPPRIAASPVGMECRLDRVIEFGALRTQLMIGEVLHFFVRDDCYNNGRIDFSALRPLARLGGPHYARLGEVIERAPVADYFTPPKTINRE